MAINFFNQASFNDVEMQEDLTPSRRLLETDLYRGKIKQVYLDAPNEGGAAFLNVTIAIMEDSSGHKIAPAFEYSQRLYVTNREGCPYFVSKTTGKQIMMPGAQIMNELSLLYLSKALKDLGESDKAMTSLRTTTSSSSWTCRLWLPTRRRRRSKTLVTSRTI